MSVSKYSLGSADALTPFQPRAEHWSDSRQHAPHACRSPLCGGKGAKDIRLHKVPNQRQHASPQSKWRLDRFLYRVLEDAGVEGNGHGNEQGQ